MDCQGIVHTILKNIQSLAFYVICLFHIAIQIGLFGFFAIKFHLFFTPASYYLYRHNIVYNMLFIALLMYLLFVFSYINFHNRCYKFRKSSIKLFPKCNEAEKFELKYMMKDWSEKSINTACIKYNCI